MSASPDHASRAAHQPPETLQPEQHVVRFTVGMVHDDFAVHRFGALERRLASSSNPSLASWDRCLTDCTVRPR